MPRVATKLKPAARGGFVARKVIPADVKSDYARLHGQRTEERFISGSMPITLARAKHREWSSEIEARIANIRAARSGEGRALTPREARALAGEWYAWYVARESNAWPAYIWEDYRAHMWAELEAAAIQSDVHAGDLLDLYDVNHAIRERVRPVVADEAKTETFLAAKRMALDASSRTLFLDYLIRDFFAAINLLARRAAGDFGVDKHAERFPRAEVPADASLTPWTLFERWISSTQPATATVDRWRATFLKLEADFPATPAAALLPEQMQSWANGLITNRRSAYTVSSVWVAGASTVFAWAVREKLGIRNPFEGWKITVPRKKRNRETKAFLTDETKIILSAALKSDASNGKLAAAKRWCPWIAAYTGARMGEVTQLRDTDVIQRDGIWALNIKPEAGSVKSGIARIVPIHQHLIKQGFLKFVKASGIGPLFHNPSAAKKDDDLTNPKRTPAVRTRNKLAEWIRELGVDDPEVQPNHGWRHTFKAIGDRCGITEKLLDAICGHAPATVGRGYGAPTVADKARALAKFPRYTVERQQNQSLKKQRPDRDLG